MKNSTTEHHVGTVADAGAQDVALGHLERIRRTEIAAIKPHFRAGMRVLEIGAGSGFQAKIVASWGCDVEAIDIEGRLSASIQFFPVQDYDGVHIPFAANSFDVVFSSNVLEHVTQLEPLLAEIRRVLKPSGLAIHIVPSPVWRFYTSLGHPAYLTRRAGQRIYTLVNKAAGHDVRNNDNEVEGNSQIVERNILLRILIAGPHGEYPSALSELYFYSRNRWLRLFRAQGFSLSSVTTNKLFYTGNCLLTGMSMRNRRVLSRLLGAACHIFVMRKSGAS